MRAGLGVTDSRTMGEVWDVSQLTILLQKDGRKDALIATASLGCVRIE